MTQTIITPKEDLYNGGRCFTKGKNYTVDKIIKTEAGLMEARVLNDLDEFHYIGSFWRDFEIVQYK